MSRKPAPGAQFDQCYEIATFSSLPISDGLNLILKAFSMARIKRMWVRLSQPSTSLAVNSGLTRIESSSNACSNISARQAWI